MVELYLLHLSHVDLTMFGTASAKHAYAKRLLIPGTLHPGIAVSAAGSLYDVRQYEQQGNTDQTTSAQTPGR